MSSQPKLRMNALRIYTLQHNSEYILTTKIDYQPHNIFSVWKSQHVAIVSF